MISFVAEGLLPLCDYPSLPLKRVFLLCKNWFAETRIGCGQRPRYRQDGYIFARRSTSRQTAKKTKGVSVRHVTGPELLDGVRQCAQEFGPMVMTVFDSWGIRSCDVGRIF
jgi:hypothetical protein